MPKALEQAGYWNGLNDTYFELELYTQGVKGVEKMSIYFEVNSQFNTCRFHTSCHLQHGDELPNIAYLTTGSKPIFVIRCEQIDHERDVDKAVTIFMSPEQARKLAENITLQLAEKSNVSD